MTNHISLISPLAEAFRLEGGPHAVLLIHGFTGSPAHMRPLGEALYSAGMTVQGIRLKGHGTDIREMMACTWEDWLRDAQDAFQALAERYPAVSVCGLSMGGVLSLILAAREPSRVSSCVTLSAPMGMANPFGSFGHLLAPFLPLVHKHNAQERQLYDITYDIGYDDIPSAKCHDLDILIKTARRSLPDIRCPLLCAQSKADGAITRGSADIIMREVSSPERQRVTLDTSPHVITIGPERERLNAEVTRFLLSHGPRS